jgi:N-acylglucosamine-6-phosphate 2-epimerase
MNELLKQLKGGMIVSCQAEGDDPFNANPEYMALFARAAEMGGAIGIRTQGIEKLKAIKRATKLPVIGLLKSQFPDGTVCITGSFNEVEQLIAAGSDIVAIDGTFRKREGLSGPEFIKEVKKRYGCFVLADIATYAEAKACEESGADCVSTTLNGYTPDTLQFHDGPNYDVLRECVKGLTIPVFAEGRYNTPAEAGKAMELNAYAVISGTAITRPRVITQWFVNEIKKVNNNNK